MGENKYFQEAQRFVSEAAEAYAVNKDNKSEILDIAKNALSSAYANTNEFQQRQLRELQQELDQLT